MDQKTFPLTGILDSTSYYLQRLLPILHGRPGREQHDSGILIAARIGPQGPIPQLMIPIGGLPMAEVKDYAEWAYGKVKALYENPERMSSHLCRDPSKHYYGGAIRAGDYILSFSGLEELEDEVLVVLVALQLGLITEEDAIEKVMRPSGSLDIYEAFKAGQ